MRKLIVLLMAGGIAFGAMGAASAEKVTTEQGTLAANQDGYVVYADGNSTNQDPFDGYLGVTSDGTVVCADEGGRYTDAGDDKNADTDTTNDHTDAACNPAP